MELEQFRNAIEARSLGRVAKVKTIFGRNSYKQLKNYVNVYFKTLTHYNIIV